MQSRSDPLPPLPFGLEVIERNLRFVLAQVLPLDTLGGSQFRPQGIYKRMVPLGPHVGALLVQTPCPPPPAPPVSPAHAKGTITTCPPLLSHIFKQLRTQPRRRHKRCSHGSNRSDCILRVMGDRPWAGVALRLGSLAANSCGRFSGGADPRMGDHWGISHHYSPETCRPALKCCRLGLLTR